MNKYTLSLLMAVFAFMLAGCESTGGIRDADVEDRGMDAAGMDDDMASTHGATRPGGFTGREMDDPANPLSRRIVYFDFDSSTVRPEDQATLRAHAEYLSGKPGLNLQLQGHADERGSREYNLALGERRAAAVQRMMVLLGADSGQLASTSYGEEKPVAYGHDEGSWSLNRRVELVY